MMLNLSQLASPGPSRLFHGLATAGSWADLSCEDHTVLSSVCFPMPPPRAWHLVSTLSMSVQRKSPLMREINQSICIGMTGGAVLKCGRDSHFGEGSH